MKAAVMRAWKAPLEIEDVELDDPGPREVLVRTVATGVCHSDLHVSGKRVVGSMMGSNRFRLDMPRYVDFYLDGRLKLDEMISARVPLEQINGAFDRMKAGEVARSVVTLEG
jgi:Zn-dependent alcohol dehydrogenase